jgi:hypothetical protein
MPTCSRSCWVSSFDMRVELPHAIDCSGASACGPQQPVPGAQHRLGAPIRRAQSAKPACQVKTTSFGRPVSQGRAIHV